MAQAKDSCNERSPTKMMNPIKQWFLHFIQLINIKSESGTKKEKKMNHKNQSWK